MQQRFTLYGGDCLAVLDTLPENSIDAVVTDPPYEIGFMNRAWDKAGVAFSPETWAKVLRVLKPGGHLVAFGGTRTYHRMTTAIEDAGFEIREMHAWVFGSGFPKSLDVSKAIDKTLGFERELVPPKSVIGHQRDIGNRRPYMDDPDHKTVSDKPASAAAAVWHGWGTATKPAMEPVCLARKPLSEKTVAANVLKWGTGALHIDATRIATDGELITPTLRDTSSAHEGWTRPWMADKDKDARRQEKAYAAMQNLGRWPASLYHDGSDEVLELFPETKSGSKAPHHKRTTSKTKNTSGERAAPPEQTFGDSGSAARFYYQAKASKSDRIERQVEEVTISWISEQSPCQVRLQADTGQLPEKAIVASGSGTAQEWNTFLFGNTITDLSRTGSKFIIATKTNSITELRTWSCLTRLLISASTAAVNSETESGSNLAVNAGRFGLSLTIILDRTVFLPGASPAVSGTPLTISVSAKQHGHPTVKPVSLMRWLARLVTPPNGVILDPFAGTGTTGQAAIEEGFRVVLIEREEEYLADIRRRMAAVLSKSDPDYPF